MLYTKLIATVSYQQISCTWEGWIPLWDWKVNVLENWPCWLIRCFSFIIWLRPPKPYFPYPWNYCGMTHSRLYFSLRSLFFFQSVTQKFILTAVYLRFWFIKMFLFGEKNAVLVKVRGAWLEERQWWWESAFKDEQNSDLQKHCIFWCLSIFHLYDFSFHIHSNASELKRISEMTQSVDYNVEGTVISWMFFYL